MDHGLHRESRRTGEIPTHLSSGNRKYDAMVEHPRRPAAHHVQGFAKPGGSLQDCGRGDSIDRAFIPELVCLWLHADSLGSLATQSADRQTHAPEPARHAGAIEKQAGAICRVYGSPLSGHRQGQADEIAGRLDGFTGGMRKTQQNSNRLLTATYGMEHNRNIHIVRETNS